MASADPGVLDRLIAVLREGSSLRLALLFGSAARDGLRPDSDLDIGILPSDPKMPLHTELDLQSRLERVAGCPVDLVRLDRASTVLKWQAARDGIPLVMRSRADLVLWPKVREAMRQREVALETLDQTALNLTTKRPAIPKENILLIEAVHDLLAPRAPIEELWQQWGQPDIWRMPHGHFSFSLIGAPGLMANRVLEWLAPRLDTGAVSMSGVRGIGK